TRPHIASPRRAIVEIVDVTRKAEARISAEFAARRHEEIIALVLHAVEIGDRRQRRRQQTALVIADTDTIGPTSVARRVHRLNAAAAELERRCAAELRIEASRALLAEDTGINVATD